MSPMDIPCRSVEGVLTLLQLPGIGQRSAAALAHAHRTLGGVRATASAGLLPASAARAAGSLRGRAAWYEAHARARRVLGLAADLGVEILTAFDAAFPPLLRAVPDGPLVLYVKGTLRPGQRNVACIGTREPSEFGVEVTRRLVHFLAGHDWGIVSGLARGIDTQAHRSALDAGGYTVAVLANGLDRVYPAENRALAAEILERGGTLVSEQPFGVHPRPANLVRRDRLQSGLSIATVVMQTDLVGGSMHTVRYTLSQGRLLVAPVPAGRHADDAKSRGLIALTGSTGTALAELLGAGGDYRHLLSRRYADRAPAFPVRSRSDYPSLLRELIRRLSRAENPAPGEVPEHLWDLATAPDREGDYRGSAS